MDKHCSCFDYVSMRRLIITHIYCKHRTNSDDFYVTTSENSYEKFVNFKQRKLDFYPNYC